MAENTLKNIFAGQSDDVIRLVDFVDSFNMVDSVIAQNIEYKGSREEAVAEVHRDIGGDNLKAPQWIVTDMTSEGEVRKTVAEVLGKDDVTAEEGFAIHDCVDEARNTIDIIDKIVTAGKHEMSGKTKVPPNLIATLYDKIDMGTMGIKPEQTERTKAILDIIDKNEQGEDIAIFSDKCWDYYYKTGDITVLCETLGVTISEPDPDRVEGVIEIDMSEVETYDPTDFVEGDPEEENDDIEESIEENVDSNEQLKEEPVNTDKKDTAKPVDKPINVENKPTNEAEKPVDVEGKSTDTVDKPVNTENKSTNEVDKATDSPKQMSDTETRNKIKEVLDFYKSIGAVTNDNISTPKLNPDTRVPTGFIRDDGKMATADPYALQQIVNGNKDYIVPKEYKVEENWDKSITLGTIPIIEKLATMLENSITDGSVDKKEIVDFEKEGVEVPAYIESLCEGKTAEQIVDLLHTDIDKMSSFCGIDNETNKQDTTKDNKSATQDPKEKYQAAIDDYNTAMKKFGSRAIDTAIARYDMDCCARDAGEDIGTGRIIYDGLGILQSNIFDTIIIHIATAIGDKFKDKASMVDSIAENNVLKSDIKEYAVTKDTNVKEAIIGKISEVKPEVAIEAIASVMQEQKVDITKSEEVRPYSELLQSTRAESQDVEKYKTKMETLAITYREDGDAEVAQEYEDKANYIVASEHGIAEIEVSPKDSVEQKDNSTQTVDKKDVSSNKDDTVDEKDDKKDDKDSVEKEDKEDADKKETDEQSVETSNDSVDEETALNNKAADDAEDKADSPDQVDAEENVSLDNDVEETNENNDTDKANDIDIVEDTVNEEDVSDNDASDRTTDETEEKDTSDKLAQDIEDVIISLTGSDEEKIDAIINDVIAEYQGDYSASISDVLESICEAKEHLGEEYQDLMTTCEERYDEKINDEIQAGRDDSVNDFSSEMQDTEADTHVEPMSNSQLAEAILADIEKAFEPIVAGDVDKDGDTDVDEINDVDVMDVQDIEMTQNAPDIVMKEAD